MQTRLALLLAVVCGVGLSVPAPAAAWARGCMSKREVVARNALLVVFYGAKDADDRQALCARYRRRRPMEISGTSLDMGPDEIHLGGRFVFLTEALYERGTGDSSLYASLIDVKRRRISHKWKFMAFNGSGPRALKLHGTRVLRTGSVAFAIEAVHPEISPSEPRSEIHRAMGPYRDMLAAGPDVDPASLRSGGGDMTWLQGGRRYRAPFF